MAFFCFANYNYTLLYNACGRRLLSCVVRTVCEDVNWACSDLGCEITKVKEKRKKKKSARWIARGVGRLKRRREEGGGVGGSGRGLVVVVVVVGGGVGGRGEGGGCRGMRSADGVEGH